MSISSELILVLLILFISTLTRSTFGFGDALIAMPLLAMVISIKIATPLIALIACIISTLILIKNWREIKADGLFQLIFFSIVGIPIGLFYLKGAGESLIKIILAVLIISFSAYKLLKPHLFTIKNDRLAFLFGIFAGILGGAYNTNGPPIVIYGTLRGWQPERFRAILQGIFLPVNLLISIGHGLTGFWTLPVFTYFLISLPVVFTAIFLGSKLNRIIPKEKFVKYIYIVLIIIGSILLIKTIE